MTSKERAIKAVHLYECFLIQNLRSTCALMAIRLKDSKYEKQREEMKDILQIPQDEFVIKFREFVATYTWDLYEWAEFRKAYELFSEYQQTHKALELLLS